MTIWAGEEKSTHALDLLSEKESGMIGHGAIGFMHIGRNTSVIYDAPCKLVRIVVKPVFNDGHFTIRDGGALGRIVVEASMVPANAPPFFLEIDHDCQTNLHATINNCLLFFIIR